MRVEIDQLLAFVRQQVPPPSFTELGLSTDLRKDLKMAEEDAEDFLVKFFDRFGVDRGDFDFARYFPVEGAPFSFLSKGRAAVVPLTVGMLFTVVRVGVWETVSVAA